MNRFPLRSATTCRLALFGCGILSLVWIGGTGRSDDQTAAGRPNSASSARRAAAPVVDPVKLIDSLPDGLFLTDQVQYFPAESEEVLAKQRLALEEYRKRHASR